MDDKEKNELLHGLLELCSPEKVILHGAKRGLSSGRLKAASLCIVVPDCDKSEVLRRLYLHMIIRQISQESRRRRRAGCMRTITAGACREKQNAF